MLSGHQEKLSNHPSPLSDIFLDQFRAAHPNEGAVSMVSNGSGKQGLPSARGPVEKHSFRLGDAQALEDFRVLDWQLDDFLDFLHLLIQAANHVVGRIGHLLDLHERD